MNPLIVVLLCAGAALAQTPTDKSFVIPDFKVTEQSLAQALPKKQSFFVYPPELRNGTTLYKISTPEPVCLMMHSYNLDKSATPKLVSESNCTMGNPNGFLRVRR